MDPGDHSLDVQTLPNDGQSDLDSAVNDHSEKTNGNGADMVSL